MDAFCQDIFLPKLPIPSLTDTSKQLKAALLPVTGAFEYEGACKLLDELSSGMESVRLQKLLLSWRDGLPGSLSWLRPLWDDSYLNSRERLPVNHNYCFRLSEKWDSKALPVLLRGLCEVLRSGYYGSLSPESVKSGNLSMDTLGHTVYTRIPGPISDTLYYPRLSEPMNAAVVCRGHWYILSLTGGDGHIQPSGTIAGALEAIKADAESAGVPPCVGAMTCAERDVAFKLRSSLCESLISRLSLQSIEKAIFVICLDESEPVPDGGRALICGEPQNRWFDKSLQIISAAGGSTGVNFEHSDCDAAIWVYLLSIADSRAETLDFEKDVPPASYRRLEWNIKASLRRELDDAAFGFRTLSESLSFSQRRIATISKGEIISHKISPDFFMQMLFQMAYYKLKGELRSVYESVSTRGFYQGRTECVRPLTAQSVALVKALADNTKPEELKSLLSAADLVHKDNLKRAKDGLGAERHMAGLSAVYNMYAGTQGYEDICLPGIFSCPAYIRLCTDALSTSSVTAPFMEHFGFGPVVSDGIGIGYGVTPSSAHLMVSAYKESGIDAHEFSNAVEEAALRLLQAAAAK